MSPSIDGLTYLLLVVPFNLEGRKPTRGVQEAIDPQVHLVSPPFLTTLSFRSR